jgi:hypothetical protein
MNRLPSTARVSRLIRAGLPLAVNVVLSWTVLPFLLPPFQGYSLSQLFEVLLWQGMGMVGWPFALLGSLLSLASGSRPDFASMLMLLVYPLILGLVILIAISKKPRRIAFVLLHVCITLSFAVMWVSVLNGYDFMTG